MEIDVVLHTVTYNILLFQNALQSK